MTNGCMRKRTPGECWSYHDETDMGQKRLSDRTEYGPILQDSGELSVSHASIFWAGVMAERERCAQICEELESSEEEGWALAGSSLASRIRGGP